MTETDGIFYTSGVDEKHADKVSAARVEADKLNAKAIAGVRPWDIERKHYDVEETSGEMYQTVKPCMFPSSLTVYVDGKLAQSVMAAGDVLSVTTVKPKMPPKMPPAVAPKGGKK